MSNWHDSFIEQDWTGVNLKDKRTQGMAFTLVLITLKESDHMASKCPFDPENVYTSMNSHNEGFDNPPKLITTRKMQTQKNAD